MLNWFEKEASIRVKFRALFWLHLALSATGAGITLMAVQGLANAPMLLFVAAAVVVATGVAVLVSGNRICTPYVNTVVRMEALAAGDIDSPIEYLEYKDCVGRMTKAMSTFRSNAAEVQQGREAQETIVQELSSGLQNLANNQLDYQINSTFPANYDQLRQDFNSAITSLSETISAVRTGASSVLTGSSEIRSASDDLSVRNEQQAASLEETSAAMNQVTGMVRETANSAAEVQRSIAEAHSEATEGGEVVNRAVTAMSEIEKSSQEISQIIGVIDGIAFQTNLLALNAGVEAARAGDAGKGFAVVANEVRALAQRSADAAKDIKALITNSTVQVGTGVSLVDETGKLLEKIVGRVGQISTLATEIARSTEDQSVNLQQVNGAVSEMDRMTQQNAAMVEESNAAARSLSDEATELSNLVARFKTGDGGTVHAIHAPTAERRKASAPAARGNLALKPVEDEDWTEF